MPLEKIDFTKPLQPLLWLVDGLFLCGYLNFLASLPGHGKTAILTHLAWQLTRPHGRFLGRELALGPAVYVDFDAPGGGRNVRHWLDQHHAAFPDGDMDKFLLLEPDFDTYGMQMGEYLEIEAAVKDTGATLIIVDSFMAAFPSTDPVKLNAVQEPLWYMRRLAAETNAAVILIDHPPKPQQGEKAGGRGILGSIAKPAQARAVHQITRLPSQDVDDRNVVRWETTKMSYGKIPKPFGVELRFDEGAVYLDPIGLPDNHGETRTDKAVRLIKDHLEQHRGGVVSRKDLLDVATTEGDLKQRAARYALKQALEDLGDEVEAVDLPGRGGQKGFQLKVETDDDVTPTAPLPNISFD